MAPNTSHQRLALAIVDFLRSSLNDGTIPSDDSESVEIASSCIAEAFHVDPSDSAAVSDALGGQNLLSIYSVYEKLKGKSTASTEGPSSAKEGRPATPTSNPKGGPSEQARAEADALKAQGNAAMQKKDNSAAIDFYTKALELVPLDPIFLSNRAAAYSAAARHEEAKTDSEMAVAADPKYSKAWSRLGFARFALGDAKGAMEAYGQGIEAEGNGGSQVMRRGYETAKKKVEEEEGTATADSVEQSARSPLGSGGGGMPDLGGLASMLGGGGGGGGGMPDLSQMMNNPMMKQMAENLMSNPDAMNNLLSNPRLREMAQRFGGGGGAGGAGAPPGGAPGGAPGGGAGGGGMPDLSSLMNDPSIAEMARNFMGGGAGRGAPQ